MRRQSVINVGDIIELAVETVNHRGEGVGRYRGMAVFVPYTVPGEELTVRIKELKKNYALGEAVNIDKPSEYRVEPACPVFYRCGGSQFQHMSYDRQLELKQRLVEDALTRIGKISGTVVHPVIGMEEPWGYRNKAQFQVSSVDGRVKLGFFEEGTHHIVPVIDCLLLDRQLRDTAFLVEDMLNRFGVTVFDWGKGRGLLRNVVIRKGWYTSKLMVILVTSPEEFKEQFAFARELRNKNPMIVSVVRNINRGRTRQVFGTESKLLAGHNTITDYIGEISVNISPTSFFQVNSLQTEVLYKKAVEYAGLTGTETVLDVYCGTGTISLFLAQKARMVIGFEVLKEAVQDAAANARNNNITNVEFVSGKAEERLPGLLSQGFSPDVIVVDPPRQGVDKKALQSMADMKPERIVYISCDPATMARDLSFLSHRGYTAKEVQPVDMFPQTGHVECVVLMSRVKK